MSNTGGLLRSGEATVSTGKLISAFYLEIEYLLDRIEHAVNHYQVLGVERSAASGEIIEAYQRAVSVLHPSHSKVRDAVTEELLARIDEAFQKVSESSSVLSDHSSRLQYDRTLSRNVFVPLPAPTPKLRTPPLPSPPPRNEATQQKAQDVKPPPAVVQPQNDATPPKKEAGSPKNESVRTENACRPAETIEIKEVAQRPVYSKTVDPDSILNRRRCERFKLGVPALVIGYDRSGEKWKEVTKTTDVGRMGVGVRMRTLIHHGTVVHVTLPLPTRLRTHGFAEQGYNVYAIVRRVEPVEDGSRIVGLEFLGAHPPPGYLDKPWATFRTQNWAGIERRREPRKKHIEQVVIDYLDAQLEIVGKEMGITEQVGSGGARIAVKSPPDAFELVRITNKNRSFESLAQVCNLFVGKDGNNRLCLKFLDAKWPM